VGVEWVEDTIPTNNKTSTTINNPTNKVEGCMLEVVKAETIKTTIIINNKISIPNHIKTIPSRIINKIMCRIIIMEEVITDRICRRVVVVEVYKVKP